MSHEMTAEDKEYYKDVADCENEYLLRMFLQAVDTFGLALRGYTPEDRFLSLKEELHKYRKVVKIRHEEVVAADKETG